MSFDEVLKRKKLFDPDALDSVETRAIFNGTTSNLINLNEVKYSWAFQVYRNMMDSFWIPENIDVTSDKNHYECLSKKDQKVFNVILSYLNFLDSIQVNNISTNYLAYVTAPEILHTLNIHAAFEGIHAQSYRYIIDSIIPKNRIKEVTEAYKTYEPLRKRNLEIQKYYTQFEENPTTGNLITSFIANYLLESLYFYNAFVYFYSLASRQLFPGVVDIIRLINKDEHHHVNFFVKILTTIMEEYPDKADSIKQQIIEMMGEAVFNETEFNNRLFDDSIPGLNSQSTIDFTKHLADQRLGALGIEKVYNISENPYSYYQRLSNTSGVGVKGNFFEASQDYAKVSALDLDI